MTYYDKLKDPRWQRKRLEVLQRDDFTCLACGAKDDQLHVHHCYYVSGRDPWQYGGEALKTLCTKCHDAVHMRNESGEQDSKWQERHGKAAHVCGEFEQLNQWLLHLFSDLKSGDKTQPASHLIISAVRLLCEERFKEEDGDTKSRTERLAKFYRAGMAGVFTDEFIESMVKKTHELMEAIEARRADK